MTVPDSAAFTYPVAADHRRHGPSGYTHYESYRPWLRDEFDFRCVYCLLRERWGRVTGEFDLDHFVPVAQAPEGTLHYGNLYYACRSCNLKKNSQVIETPAFRLSSRNVRVTPDGRLTGTSPAAQALIDTLTLNSPKWVH